MATPAWGGLHPTYVIGLLCLSIGLFLQLIALVSSQWSLKEGTPTYYYGLWDMCIGKVCKEHTPQFTTDSIRACQVFAVIGMVLGCCTLILGVVFALMTMLKKCPRKIIPMIAMICGSVSFLIINAAVITWSGGMPFRHEVKNGYSLAVSILASLFIAAGGCQLFLCL